MSKASGQKMREHTVGRVAFGPEKKRKPFQGARPDEFAGGKTLPPLAGGMGAPDPPQAASEHALKVGRVAFGPEKKLDYQGYVDRLVQQDDLIRRQHAALKQIFTYASAIPEIGAAPGKIVRAEINLMVRAIVKTAQLAL